MVLMVSLLYPGFASGAGSCLLHRVIRDGRDLDLSGRAAI
jgi:hypothetical protein